MSGGTLSDLRVLDIATFLAAPFCGTLLADFGADVIKIEQPGAGDSLRRFGTVTECGDSLVWMSEARNKRSMTLDLRTAEGAEVFRGLVAKSDVVLENFRPGTLERWGLGYEALAKINPRLVMLRVSAYGQTGPKKDEPGFARVAHAFSGLAFLAGEPGRQPVVPGSTSLADYASGLFGAIGVLVALRHAERTGQGQVIDIGLYESIFRLLDELAPAFARDGFERQRMGADTVNTVPHSHYETGDGHWVAIACSNDRMWGRLCTAMARPDLIRDERYATMAARNRNRDDVNRLVADWAHGHDCTALLDIAAANDVPISKILSIADIFADPHYAARGNIVRVEDDRLGELALPRSPIGMSLTPPALASCGPALGGATEAILSELLGLSAGEIGTLRAAGAI